MDHGHYESTSQSSYVNHNKDDIHANHDAKDAYTQNKAKAHMPSTWATSNDQTQYSSSYKTTYNGSPPRATSQQPSPDKKQGGQGVDQQLHAGSEYNILNGTKTPSFTRARQPGTFFAGRVSAAKLEAHSNARDPNFDIISHETHADHREYAGYHQSAS